MHSEIQRVFTEHYENNVWGNECKSGPGSTVEQNKEYIRIIENLIKAQNIKSVVDLGCGDWTFSQLIEWGGLVDYLGVDIVEPLIKELQTRYGMDNRRFIFRDFINDFFFEADLFIIKDVLHHLSNENIIKFIKQHLPHCKMALITNDVYRDLVEGNREEMGYTFYQTNHPIKDGESRPLSINIHPFGLQNLINLGSSYRIETIGSSEISFLKKTELWIRTE